MADDNAAGNHDRRDTGYALTLPGDERRHVIEKSQRPVVAVIPNPRFRCTEFAIRERALVVEERKRVNEARQNAMSLIATADMGGNELPSGDTFTKVDVVAHRALLRLLDAELQSVDDQYEELRALTYPYLYGDGGLVVLAESHALQLASSEYLVPAYQQAEALEIGEGVLNMVGDARGRHSDSPVSFLYRAPWRSRIVLDLHGRSGFSLASSISRNQADDIIDGDSGAPVMMPGTNKVVGIHSRGDDETDLNHSFRIDEPGYRALSECIHASDKSHGALRDCEKAAVEALPTRCQELFQRYGERCVLGDCPNGTAGDRPGSSAGANRQSEASDALGGEWSSPSRQDASSRLGGAWN